MANASAHKGPKKMERHFKGVANHRRIQILLYVAKNEHCSLDDIVVMTGCNMKTIADHTRRLMLAGLIEKRYKGREVEHSLTPYGRLFVDFISEFSRVGSKE